MIFDLKLRAFNAVARRSSFTKAAEELFITQPAVTKQIKALEEHFGASLFERHGNSISLTPTGEILFNYTRKMEHLYVEMEQEISFANGNAKGTLNIGASTTISQYILPSILSAFRNKHPDISLNIISDNTEHIGAALINGAIDLGFIEGRTKNKQIKYTFFRNDELVLVGRKGHPLEHKRSVSLSDILKIPFVMREPGSGTLEVILHALKKEKISWSDLQVEIQLDSTEAIKYYLLNSDCLSFISGYAMQGIFNDHILKIIQLKELKITRPLNVIHLHGEPSHLARLFLKFALSHN